MKILFNKPFITGNELDYIEDVITKRSFSGNGSFTKKCQIFFKNNYGFQKCLLTTSCTDALEMAALLIDFQPNDEVIMPSYTFVSTANSFALRGGKIRFADSRSDHPGLNEDQIEDLINENTKAIVVVHYAGVACNMEKIMNLADKYDLYVIEDSAQAIDSYYTFSNGTTKPLGSIGHFSTFSFHDTKNIIAGEGGMLVINEKKFHKRSEIIWEKGTNRSAFFRGEVDKYGWVDLGSSFLPSELTAAFLYAQLEEIQKIQKKRIEIWDRYHTGLERITCDLNIQQPIIPDYATNNGHMYYLVCQDGDQREKLINYLNQRNIKSVFHYQSLHKSKYYKDKHDGRDLIKADLYTDCLVRLPFYYELKIDEQNYIINCVHQFFDKK